MNLAGVEVGPDEPCRFVAEISNNHNGSLDMARRLVIAAKDAGADYLKTQCYTASELVTLRGDGPAPSPWGAQGWRMRQLYEKAQTPFAWFPDLVALCHELDLPWFSSVFGPESLALLESLNCPIYKLAALDYGQLALRRMVEDTGKPVIRSCPQAAVTAWRRRQAYLYCPPGYPQSAPHLHNLRNGYDGFSYHGTDPVVPVLAAAMGAQLIECHFQLDNERSELEANVSLTAREFGDMVVRVRQAEALAA